MLLTTTDIHHVDILNNDLPFDIITSIFSFLDQEECINCMAVNRSWFHQVPIYTRDIWKQVRLSESDIRMPNYRRERCIRYTNSVKLDSFREEEELHFIMNKLLIWGCDGIESLSKQRLRGIRGEESEKSSIQYVFLSLFICLYI